jgi:hypothetical protein
MVHIFALGLKGLKEKRETAVSIIGLKRFAQIHSK